MKVSCYRSPRYRKTSLAMDLWAQSLLSRPRKKHPKNIDEMRWREALKNGRVHWPLGESPRNPTSPGGFTSVLKFSQCNYGWSAKQGCFPAPKLRSS